MYFEMLKDRNTQFLKFGSIKSTSGPDLFVLLQKILKDFKENICKDLLFFGAGPAYLTLFT